MLFFNQWSMREGNRIYVNWHSDRQGSKKNDDRYCLDSQLVAFVLSKLDIMEASDFDNGYCLEGFTRIMTKMDFGSKILLYAHPSFQGREWYDWVYVHFEEINASGDAIENYYPARILGCALPDYGSGNTSYIIVLPKHNWSRYFGNKIDQ